MMFYLGDTRSANTILAQQDKDNAKQQNFDALVQMCELAHELKDALNRNDLSSFGELLDANWHLKRSLTQAISNPLIDELYDKAIAAGASGGKLLGAGGGGFLLMYCLPAYQQAVKNALKLRTMSFEFEHDGTSVVYIGDKYWD
jgi:D-glycero-alpha-D-manno-heptose-7-phosphate kinase